MYQATTHYPSLGRAFDDSSAAPGPLMIDGLDVVDEQVVPLAPIDPTRSRRRIRKEARHGLG